MLARSALSLSRLASVRTLQKLPATGSVLGGVRFAGGGPTGYGSGPYRGLKVPKVAEWHKNLATVYGTTLWLWLMWRCKQDGAALIVSLVPRQTSALRHIWIRAQSPLPSSDFAVPRSLLRRA